MNPAKFALIALGCSLVAGCADLEQPSTEGALALEGASCFVEAPSDGKWPGFSPWAGKAPQPISTDQLFLIVPGNAQGSEFVALQIDWVTKRVAWATKVPKTQRGSLVATLAAAPGSITTLNGTRPPIKYPPGDDWLQDAVQIHSNIQAATDAIEVFGDGM